MTVFTGLHLNDEMVLCHLRTVPEQRLVHQHASPPDAGGHCVFPESVFLRCGPAPIGPRLPGGKPTFRRLLKCGWLSVASISGSAAAGSQIEYQLSPAAQERFDRLPGWRDAEDAWRRVARMPPRLKIVTAGAQ